MNSGSGNDRYGNDGRYDEGGYDPSRYDQGRYDQGRYDDGRYDQGRYDQGRYDQGHYDDGRYPAGRYDDGRYGDERRRHVERRPGVRGDGLWAESDRAYEPPPRRRGRHGGHGGHGGWHGGRRRVLDIRLLAPIAIPMALALVLGMVLAMAGTHTTQINQAALGTGAGASPTASAVNAESAAAAAAAATGAGDTSTTSAAAPGDQNPAPATTPASASAPAAAAGMNCALVVPDHPLSAAGLATPWQLTGQNGQSPAASGCQQSNPNDQAFVQATIINPANGALSVYQPLVITAGTTPAAAPVMPRLPDGAVVDIMVGFNGATLQLVGAQQDTLGNAHCVNGHEGSPFGQVAYCDSVAFYAAARNAIAAGTLKIPATGTSPVTGQQCPTTRSFDVVDQDQSDNVTTQYLLTGDGRTAQDSTANAAALAGATVINNGSDNRLLDNFLLPALGCTPFTAPDLSAGGAPGTSQTLDELSAMVNQQAPVALVPLNDPMTMVNGQVSHAKTNLYRLGVGQPLLEGIDGFGQGPNVADTQEEADYCASMINSQAPFLAANTARFTNFTTPVPAMGNNLFTFMAARLSASFTNLNCANFGLKNPVAVTTDGNGVAVAATLNVTPQLPQLAPQPQQPDTAPAPGGNALTEQSAQGGQWWQQLP